jgi:hypothetical protein
MPSIKKRLSLTIDDDISNALDDFAKASGTAKASFVVSILRESLPLIQGMTKAFKMAKKNPADALQVMSDQMMQVQISCAQQQLDLDKKSKKVRPRVIKK